MKKKSKKIKTLDTTIHKADLSDENMGFEGLTDPRKIKIAQLLAHAGYTGKRRVRGCVAHVARTYNINRQTIYYWLKTDPNFEIAIEEARAELCAMAHLGIEELVKAGNVSACIFILERLLPETYSKQYRKFQYNKELLEFKAKLNVSLAESNQAFPVIIIQGLGEESPEYERNRI